MKNCQTTTVVAEPAKTPKQVPYLATRERASKNSEEEVKSHIDFLTTVQIMYVAIASDLGYWP